MKRYLVLIIAFGTGFFLVGIAWGIWAHKRQADDLARSQPLRILCGENWISDSVLEKFSREHGVRIQQWTYSRPSEFLRQMANADGNVDVLCTSSLLVKSLVKAHWLKKGGLQNLPNMKLVAVDFAHLPFDQNAEYVVPAFWNLYGFFGKGETVPAMAWKQIWQSKKFSFWGAELNVLQLMNQLGLNIEQRMEEEENSKANKSLDDEIRHFVKSGTGFSQPGPEPLSADALLEKVNWAEVPLARVAKFLMDGSEYKFWLPEDGAVVEVGVYGIGDKSSRPELASQLINELIGTDEALALHTRMEAGVLNSSLGGLNAVLPMQKPSALRAFPLNRLKFPDLDLEALPTFEKIFEETVR